MVETPKQAWVEVDTTDLEVSVVFAQPVRPDSPRRLILRLPQDRALNLVAKILDASEIKENN